MLLIGRSRTSPEKGRTKGRSLTIFKSLFLVMLMVITLYGMLNQGLFSVERWLPATVAILGLFFIALFVVNYFSDTPKIAWVLVGILAALVAIKGLSLTWSISRTETVEELLRSSMYLATFTIAVASLSSRRLVGPFVDGMNLIAGVVAGYGILQKVAPAVYSAGYSYDIRVNSTLGYPNTVAVIVAMGITLGLGRMTELRNPLTRGLYAALILVFGVILYLTFSYGGVLALGLGLVTLFAVSGSRLQMFANLLLVCGPLVWVLWKVQGLPTFFSFADEDLRAADGLAFGVDLTLSVLASFLLQAVYAVLVGRYRLPLTLRRSFGAAAMVAVLVGVGAIGLAALGDWGGPDEIRQTSGQEIWGIEYIKGWIPSLSSDYRLVYWRVAWDEWRERPLAGTGAGTFMYTWQQNRPGFDNVEQVHNLYLEQGTETGAFAFLALLGFVSILVVYLVRSALRADGQRKILLSALAAAAIVYLVSSAFERHWYIPPSTLFFFVLVGVAVKFASRAEWWGTEERREVANGNLSGHHTGKANTL
ncbi:MAG: O-antigen ligase family protein [Actinomycetota bacterium]|nr:O-antigen ligase family protein [Actinomycetota bacterium]